MLQRDCSDGSYFECRHVGSEHNFGTKIFVAECHFPKPGRLPSDGVVSVTGHEPGTLQLSLHPRLAVPRAGANLQSTQIFVRPVAGE